jgi:hypothetical protein
MSKAGYSLVTATAGGVPLVAATAKSVLSVIAPAQFGVDFKKLRFGTDGVTASALPILVELCRSTQATAGTSGTAVTVVQTYGPTITAGFTGGSNFSAEPTALTVLESWLVDPNKSTVLYDYPLGDTYDTAVSQAIVLRCTAPAAVNVRATFVFERT